jgi:hypothetical protein
MKKFKTLHSWIAEAISDSEKEAACSALACVYRKNEGGTREVYSVKLTGKTWDAKSLAELFQGKAEAYAQDFPGISTFEIQAFYGTNEAQAIHTFVVVDGEVQAEGRGRNVRESADGQGLIAQAMRHVERTHDSLLKICETMAVTTVQRETRWADREAKLQEEITDCYTIIRDMMMKQNEVEHNKELERMKMLQNIVERKKLLEIAPALANTISGREIFPQSVVDTSIVESFAKKVNPQMLDQLTKLGVIDNELAGVLAARFAQIAERAKKEAEELKRIPPAGQTPELDVAGEREIKH